MSSSSDKSKSAAKPANLKANVKPAKVKVTAEADKATIRDGDLNKAADKTVVKKGKADASSSNLRSEANKADGGGVVMGIKADGRGLKGNKADGGGVKGIKADGGGGVKGDQADGGGSVKVGVSLKKTDGDDTSKVQPRMTAVVPPKRQETKVKTHNINGSKITNSPFKVAVNVDIISRPFFDYFCFIILF